MSADCQCPPAPKPTLGQVVFMWHALIPGIGLNMMRNAVNAAPPVVMARWVLAARPGRTRLQR